MPLPQSLSAPPAPIELSWALQSALSAGVTVACAGVAVTFKRPAMRALAAAYLLITVAAAIIWAAVTAGASGMAPQATSLILALAPPLTPVMAFFIYRHIISLLAGTETSAFPPWRKTVAVALIAFIVFVGMAVVGGDRAPQLIGVGGTAGSLLGLAWLGVMAQRAKAAERARTWAIGAMQWSFAALAARSGLNVAVAAAALMTGSAPRFSLSVTVLQAALIVIASALQLVAVLDEERAHSLQQAEQLRQAELTRAASQRLESLGRMAGAVAHDFNNVLGVISISVGAARVAPEGLEDDLAEIEASARRGKALTAQLLAFARQEPQQVTRFDVRAHVAQLRGVLERIVGRSVTIEMDFADALQLVDMEVMQFEQVVINLVANARDAMHGAGKIRIGVTAGAPELGVSEAAAADVADPHAQPVVLSVSDTGDGISTDVLPRIFEPFFSTKPTGEGTGLGLAICNGIVMRAGGRIAVRSEVGKGTTFDVVLPRALSRVLPRAT